MKKFLQISLSILLLFIFSNYTYSQVDDPKGKFVDRIKKVLKEKLIDQLEFDEQTADKYVELYYIAADETFKLNRERLKILKYFDENPDAEDIEQKLEEFIEIETKIVELRKDFLTGIKDILTSKQLAQSVVFQNKFNRFLREQINKFIKKERDKKPKRRFDENQ